MHRRPFALLLTLMISASAAQAAVLRGHVTDAGNHILPGATVRVEPGDVTTVSDRDGNFVIADLKPGTYIVEISYVGFLSASREVNVGGAPVTLDVKMNLSPSVSESVTVTASRERGEVEALNERKRPTATRISIRIRRSTLR